MKIIKASAEHFPRPKTPVETSRHIEKCGRVCYKSEGKISDYSYRGFIDRIIKRGHEAVLEHGNIIISCGSALEASHVRDCVLLCQSITGRTSYLRFSVPQGIVSGNVRAWRDFLRAVCETGNQDVRSIRKIASVLMRYGVLFADVLPRNMPISQGDYEDIQPERLQVFTRDPETALKLARVHQCETIKFITDRGVSHEIVRHRPASYCQESTRYCNYSKDEFGRELTFIEPCMFAPETPPRTWWERLCADSETAYFALLKLGASAQEARSVLPNSLKTEIVMTATLGEWEIFAGLRTSPAAHPQMREVATRATELLTQVQPVIFRQYLKG